MYQGTDARPAATADYMCQPPNPALDREMAAKALVLFEQKKYQQSFTILKKLYAKRHQDFKVYHNCAVIQFYLSDCRGTNDFTNEMHFICKKLNIDNLDLENLDDFDHCIALFNQAVNLFHFDQFTAALLLLEKIFQYVDTFEEHLARNVCFLMMDCYIGLCEPKKALGIAGYMESVMIGGNKPNANKSNKKEKDSHKEDASEHVFPEAAKRKLQLFKARCYALMKTSKACKKEIKNVLSSGTQIQNIPAFYLKSQLEYQRGNYRKALKLLNSITLPDDVSKYFQSSGAFLPANYYNNVGCIHFYMGKPNLGQFYIEKALNEFADEINSISEEETPAAEARPTYLMSVSTRFQLLHNLGMQFMQSRNFRKAYDCFNEVLLMYPSNPRLWLRIAECCIQLSKPDCTDQYVEITEKSFIKSVVGTGTHRKLIINPSSDEKSTTEPEEEEEEESDEPEPSLCYALHCLKNALSLIEEIFQPPAPKQTKQSSPNSSGDSSSTVASTEPEAEASKPEEITLSVLPSNYLQGPEIQSLKNSALLSSSYVSLCLGDVQLAYSYAKTLLAQPKISAAHKFLAHQYAGEALLTKDKITEAIEHMNQSYSKPIELASAVKASEPSLKHQPKFDSEVSEKNEDGSRPVGNVPLWMPDTLSTAKYVTQYNLAVAYAHREEWAKAMDCLFQLNPNGKVPKQALSLLLYVQTHQGTAKETKSYVADQAQAGSSLEPPITEMLSELSLNE